MGLKGCVLTLRSKRLENLVTIDMVYDNKETWMPLDLYFLGGGSFCPKKTSGQLVYKETRLP